MKINTKVPRHSLKQLAITLSIGTTLGFVYCLGESALAQTINAGEGPQNYQLNERDPLTGSNGFDPFKLIHNAQLNNINIEEFNRNSAENIEDAASAFKRQQLELLRNRKQESTVSEPSSEN